MIYFFVEYVLITLISVILLYQGFNFIHTKDLFPEEEKNQLFLISKADTYVYGLL